MDNTPHCTRAKVHHKSMCSLNARPARLQGPPPFFSINKKFHVEQKAVLESLTLNLQFFDMLSAIIQAVLGLEVPKAQFDIKHISTFDRAKYPLRLLSAVADVFCQPI